MAASWLVALSCSGSESASAASAAEARRSDSRFLRRLFWDNQKLSGYMASYRFLRTFTKAADPAVLKWQRRRVDDFLKILEAQVMQAPCCRQEATIADLSICAYLSFPADETDYNLSAEYPGVHAWLAQIADPPKWRPPSFARELRDRQGSHILGPSLCFAARPASEREPFRTAWTRYLAESAAQ